jgi:hypothetical protein
MYGITIIAARARVSVSPMAFAEKLMQSKRIIKAKSFINL